MIDAIIRHKYFYHPNPTNCPICGYNHLLKVCCKDSCVGLYKKRKKDETVWYCPENELELLDARICEACGQPVFFKPYDFDELNCFYIYIDAFIGWYGNMSMCLSINVSTKKAICTMFIGGLHQSIALNKGLISWIVDHALLFLTYKANRKEEGDWYDANIYNFRFFQEHESNEISFSSPYEDRHPLFTKLVQWIDYVHWLRIKKFI